MPHLTCIRCGKPLTNPVSQSVGLGPICRLGVKKKAMKEKSGSLFRATYSYEIDDNIIAINDHGGDVSVTNDLRQILKEIRKSENIKLEDFPIMYKDSFNIWDGLTYENGNISFFSINEKEYLKAKHKLLARKSKTELVEEKEEEEEST